MACPEENSTRTPLDNSSNGFGVNLIEWSGLRHPRYLVVDVLSDVRCNVVFSDPDM